MGREASRDTNFDSPASRRSARTKDDWEKHEIRRCRFAIAVSGFSAAQQESLLMGSPPSAIVSMRNWILGDPQS